MEEAGRSAKGRKRPGIKKALQVREGGDAQALLELAALLPSAQRQG